jgi:two-component system, NarL family, sensor kinase
VGAMLMLVVLLLPGLWFMLRSAHRQREARLHRQIDVLRDERRRAAARLHEGAVQDLAAATLVIVGLAGRAQRGSDPTLGADLRDVADHVRQAALDQRTLLAGLYPAELAESALESQLDEAAVPARAAGVAVELFLADDALAALTLGDEELVRRVGEEMLRNVARHARATRARVSLVLDHDHVVLEVDDDGIGFDPGVLSDPEFGHLGTRGLGDLAREAGARLALRTAPGSGTAWRLVVSASAD